MGYYVVTTYCCPHCGNDLNAQNWLPPTTLIHLCRSCGSRVERSGESIRSAWTNFFAWLSFVVFGGLGVVGAALTTLGTGKADLALPFIIGGLISGAIISIPLRIVGWVIGATVASSVEQRGEAPEDGRRAGGYDTDARSAPMGLTEDGVVCLNCSKPLSRHSVSEGWCEECGKQIPHAVLSTARRLQGH
jgi:hypothetical protein